MKSLKFSCSDELRAWIEQKAEREHRSVSQVIRLALYESQQTEANGQPLAEAHTPNPELRAASQLSSEADPLRDEARASANG